MALGGSLHSQSALSSSARCPLQQPQLWPSGTTSAFTSKPLSTSVEYIRSFASLMSIQCMRSNSPHCRTTLKLGGADSARANTSMCSTAGQTALSTEGPTKAPDWAATLPKRSGLLSPAYSAASPPRETPIIPLDEGFLSVGKRSSISGTSSLVRNSKNAGFVAYSQSLKVGCTNTAMRGGISPLWMRQSSTSCISAYLR